MNQQKKRTWKKNRLAQILMSDIKLGQYLYVEKESYYVASKVKNRQKNFVWVELELRGSRGSFWLSAEKENGELLLSLNSSINFRKVKFDNSGKTARYNEKTYTFIESGTAVVESFTHGDYDPKERFSFKEYEDLESGNLLSVEVWSDEVEASVGRRIDVSDVILDNETQRKNVKVSSHSISSSIFEDSSQVVILIFALVIFMFSLLGNEMNSGGTMTPISNTTISSGIEENTYFNYVTNITLDERKKNYGKVYSFDSGIETGPETLEEVARTIISMNPERMESVYSMDDMGSDILVIMGQEQALIYEGADDEIYVQVSPVEEEDAVSSAPYNARDTSRTSSFYRYARRRRYNNTGITEFSTDDGKTYTINDTYFDSYTRSARDASISSRQSSGGGTGFGK